MDECEHGQYYTVCACGRIERGTAGDGKFVVPDGWTRVGNDPVCPDCREVA